MVYLILAGICWTVGTWDWLVVACLVLGAIDIARRIVKVVREIRDKREGR